MRTLAIDLETYSDRDIAEAGAYAYAESPAFSILLIGYKFDSEDEPTVIDLGGMGTVEDATDYIELMYPEFLEALKDPETIKTAYNANFERTCLARYWGDMPPEQWRCTKVLASTLGLPGSLEEVGRAIGLSEDTQKLDTGKALISYFCKPCKPTKANGGRTRNLPAHAPDKWELFKEYNKRDVVAEQAILSRLEKYRISPQEQKLWEWDQRMNDHGILLDIPFVEGILRYDNLNRARLLAEAKELTEMDNPNSLPQLKQWLNANGLPMQSITKETVDAALALQFIPDNVRRMLQIRKNLGKTSTAKYQAMLEAVCSDHRLRGILQFYGANRTGRWAGRIVQVHNLPQNKIPDIDYAREMAKDGRFEDMEDLFGELPFVFSQLIRTAFIASPGNSFIVSDFSAIEARVIAWLADEEWRLKVFREGGDIYCASASQMFHLPVEKHGVNSHLRQKGKVAELALGYQGGFGAMKRMDTTGSIPEEDIPVIIQNWREASPRICKLWYIMEQAAKACIREKRSIKIQHDVVFSYADRIMFIQLPSGRKIAYWDARVETLSDGKEHITYAGVDQETKRWGRQETYGGKLVENVVQAVARDCLAHAMLKVAAAGYQIVCHVHDEMIVDVPDADAGAFDTINRIMGEPAEWAKGLPLRGDGYKTKHYKKD